MRRTQLGINNLGMRPAENAVTSCAGIWNGFGAACDGSGSSMVRSARRQRIGVDPAACVPRVQGGRRVFQMVLFNHVADSPGAHALSPLRCNGTQRRPSSAGLERTRKGERFGLGLPASRHENEPPQIHSRRAVLRWACRWHRFGGLINIEFVTVGDAYNGWDNGVAAAQVRRCDHCDGVAKQ